jgi:hypothetical protein
MAVKQRNRVAQVMRRGSQRVDGSRHFQVGDG